VFKGAVKAAAAKAKPLARPAKSKKH